MKHLRKSLAWVLALCLCLFALTACGSKADSAQAIDPAQAQALQTQTVSLLESITAIPADQMPLVIEQNTEAGYEGLAAGLSAYMGVTEDLGAYISCTPGAVSISDDGGYTISLDCSFEKRACTFTIMLDKKLSNITSMSFNPVYTLGENMTKAALNTLIGLGTVFLVLIFISLLISCFKYISVAENALKKKKAAPAAAAPAPAPAAAAAAEEEENLTDDLELVAVITAAIAASMGSSGDGLVVRSIRRADTGRRRRA